MKLTRKQIQQLREVIGFQFYKINGQPHHENDYGLSRVQAQTLLRELAQVIEGWS